MEFRPRAAEDWLFHNQLPKTAESGSWHVRIRQSAEGPQNRMFLRWGIHLDVLRGWYRVLNADKDLLTALLSERHLGLPLIDVCTMEESEQLEASLKATKVAKAEIKATPRGAPVVKARAPGVDELDITKDAREAISRERERLALVTRRHRLDQATSVIADAVDVDVERSMAAAREQSVRDDEMSGTAIAE